MSKFTLFTKEQTRQFSHNSLKNAFWLLLLLPYLSFSQVSFTPTGLTYSQDFNTLTSAGTWTNNSTLTGWYAKTDATASITTYALNTGSSTGAALYSFGSTSSSDRALGYAPSNAFFGSSGTGKAYMGLRFVNNTAATINSLSITWSGEQWRKADNAAVHSLSLSHQKGSSVTDLTAGTWTSAASSFSSPITGATGTATLDGNLAANRASNITVTLSLNVLAGEEIMLRWEDLNDSGNDHLLAIDDISVTATIVASNSPFLSASPTALTGLDYIAGSGPSVSKNYTLTGTNLTSDLTVTPPTNFEISNTSATSGFQTMALTLTPSSGSINATIHVRLIAGLTANPSYTGTITHTGGGLSSAVNVSVSGKVTSPATITKISAIQGSGMTTTLIGSHTIEGIVTRTFLGSTKLQGFNVQEEDADSDGDANTSEGIFVYDPAGLFTGNQGDKVQVTGTPFDFSTGSGASSLTELTSLTNVIVISTGNPLPTVTNVQLPVAAVSDLEKYEGMLINVSAASGNLTVSDNFELGQYGQLMLSVTGASNQTGTDGRLEQYTQFNAPSVSGYAAYLTEIAKRRIYLDDGSSTSYPNPIIFGRGGNVLSASNTIRTGDELASITAILDHRGTEGYKLQTTTGVNFQPTNARPSTPSVGGTLVVGSFNVLNYFNGPTFPTARGANNATEFTRQRNKTLQAIIQSGADVLGLNEIENDGYGSGSAIDDLVSGLNATAGTGTYAYITPSASIATDAITVGIIYKPAKVQPSGAAAFTSSTFTSFDAVGRKPLAQTFKQVSNNAQFTFVITHFKSKGGTGSGNDADMNDGQAAFNDTRKRQSADLTSWLATNPTGTTDPDYLLAGDFNAYAMEDPITTIINAGYPNTSPTTSHSYAFDGQFGSLDHIFRSASLASYITGSIKWNINADEPIFLDYNTENKSSSTHLTSLYNADSYRASDHDPVIVGLDLPAVLPVEMVSFTAKATDNTTLLNWTTASESNNAYFDIEHSMDGQLFQSIGQVKGNGTTQSKSNYAFVHESPAMTVNYYRLKQVDTNGKVNYSKMVSVDFDKNENEIQRIYPTSTTHQLTVEYTLSNTSDNVLRMTDMAGKVVLSKILVPTNGQKLNVEVGDLPQGLYFIQLGTNGKLHKFFKM
jgi:uncharacterized protein